MPHNRYFVDADLRVDASCHLEGGEFHHLARVLRARTGERVELVNGRGFLAEAEVASLSKDFATLEVHSVYEEKAKKRERILIQALPQMTHLEWIIEKGTELDATAFWLFEGMYSEKKGLSPNQLERLTHLSIAAMKQCGRLDLPSILWKPPLTSWEPLQGTLFFGDLSEDAPYLWEVPGKEGPTYLCIGPEKGLHPKERSHLLDQMGGCGVRLHKNILRAETAPLVGISLLQINY
ncbi:MAG: 16S rRNA (uracil(1498)-N(3))-methyltransferase [Verrucomicrobia bacterium]|nr:16S rRNA (uracil(1498)-N(3))-methyltransferase [Verrucomicrobiota bacterium]